MTDIDLVVFQVAGIRYAADLGQVRRIDVHDEMEAVPPRLGAPHTGTRALVFSIETGIERRLSVDKVFGVSRVPVSSLRRIPPAVNAAPYSIGAWLDGDETVLLVDLNSMV
jgi:chemotaxis signal transduction protein